MTLGWQPVSSTLIHLRIEQNLLQFHSTPCSLLCNHRTLTLVQFLRARKRQPCASSDRYCPCLSFKPNIFSYPKNCIVSCHIHNFVPVCNLKFPKNSNRKFPKNSSKIPKKIPKNSKTIPKTIPKKFSKNSQKILKKL